MTCVNLPATIVRFETPYEEGSRTIMPVHVSLGKHIQRNAIIELRAPRSAVNLLWSLAPQYAGKVIQLSWERAEEIGGRLYLRGVKILR